MRGFRGTPGGRGRREGEKYMKKIEERMREGEKESRREGE